ncbi:MAG: DegT/DnrJ/EryC1/StrS family aminotransferase [Helicobacteraceae bacterium]
MQIPIAKTVFDECEKAAIVKPLESGWVVQGQNVANFEQMFCDFTRAGFAKASTSCTSALHLGLEALGIGAGDEVLVPSFTYVASANAIEYTGAAPVFCDINLATLAIDETRLEEIIKSHPKAKAIMPVHLFGVCANMPAIMALAQKYGLKVIEDSACGFDAWIGERHSGTFGDCGCFSFHPRKSICTGEGGMLVTNSQDLANKVASLRDHGAQKSDLARHKSGGFLLPDFPVRGFNYRMTDFQGALGVCQMEKKDYIMSSKRRFAAKLDRLISEKLSGALIPQALPSGYTHGYQSYVCLFTGGDDLRALTKEKVGAINARRNVYMQRLDAAGVTTRQGTHAVHTLSYYKNKYGLSDWDFPNAYTADKITIALPLYATMSDEEFDYLASALQDCL